MEMLWVSLAASDLGSDMKSNILWYVDMPWFNVRSTNFSHNDFVIRTAGCFQRVGNLCLL